jgi:predicted nucleic acid-binding protein
LPARSFRQNAAPPEDGSRRIFAGFSESVARGRQLRRSRKRAANVSRADGNRAGAGRQRLPRKVLNRGKLEQALEDLDSFDIRVHLELFTARRVVELARRYQLQGYDALYFELARTLGLPLATLDHGHRQAAGVHNLKVFTSG